MHSLHQSIPLWLERDGLVVKNSMCVCVCVCMCSWQREVVRNALDSRFPKRRWLTAQVAKLLGPEAH